MTLTLDGPSREPDWGATLKTVKEQLRAVPRRGLGYEALARLGSPDPAARALRELPLPQVCFNYHGQWESARGRDFAPAGEVPGRDMAAGAALDHLLDVSAVVADGVLELTWHYSDQVHDESTVRELADGTARALAAIAAHCERPDAGGRTPSDFPLARLDQAGVDRLAGDGRAVEDILPLTPLQEGMLFHRLMGGADDVYLDQATLLLDGVADPRAFARAWQRVVDRTPVLRTSVVWENVPVPLQIVHRRVTVPTVHLDWRDSRRRAADGRTRPDPGRGPGPGPGPRHLAPHAAHPDPAARREAASAVDLAPSDPGRLEPGAGPDRGVRGVRRTRRGPRADAARTPAVRRLCALAVRPGRPRGRGALAHRPRGLRHTDAAALRPPAP